MGPKVHHLHALLASMAYRHKLGHPECMGKHFTPPEGHRVQTPPKIQLLTVQCWTVMNTTQISAFMTTADDSGPKSFNIGADILDYQLLSLPSLGQIIWCLGDEIQHSWRELSSPK